jgi:hypothetical protein
MTKKKKKSRRQLELELIAAIYKFAAEWEAMTPEERRQAKKDSMMDMVSIPRMDKAPPGYS